MQNAYINSALMLDNCILVLWSWQRMPDTDSVLQFGVLTLGADIYHINQLVFNISIFHYKSLYQCNDL